MREPTGYSEKRYEEHPPGLENLPEIEERLWEKAGDQAAAIWPGAEREEARLEGKASFQDEAREWWRTRGAGLDIVESDLAMYRHGDLLDGRLKEADRQGAAFGEVLLEMLREYRELDHRIESGEAQALAQEAARHAIQAQEIIGHDLHDGSHHGPWNAQERADAMARHLQRSGGRNIDPGYLGSIFRDLETVVQHAENVASLERGTDVDVDHVLDRATLDLVDWAIYQGEYGRWADGKRLGWDLNEAEQRRMDAHHAQALGIEEQGLNRAPDPSLEPPAENVMEWALRNGYLDSWMRDYRDVLDALDGDRNVTRPPDWALTARGQLRRQGAERMRAAVAGRLGQLEEIQRESE